VIFIDANIFMYAAGKDCPQKRPSQKFLSHILAEGSKEKACTNAEVLQEILHRYTSIGAAELGFQIFDLVLSLGLQVLPIEVSDIIRAKAILEEDVPLSSRDAVHLGVMHNHGISKVATFDKGFLKIPWVKIIEL
jgi:predicted nucleic acid-binding protein